MTPAACKHMQRIQRIRYSTAQVCVLSPPFILDACLHGAFSRNSRGKKTKEEGQHTVLLCSYTRFAIGRSSGTLLRGQPPSFPSVVWRFHSSSHTLLYQPLRPQVSEANMPQRAPAALSTHSHTQDPDTAFWGADSSFCAELALITKLAL